MQMLLVQVPPCTENLAANITCTIPEDVFAAWPQLNRAAFYVYDNNAEVAQNVSAGRRLQASVAAQAPVGDFQLSVYRVCPSIAQDPRFSQCSWSLLHPPGS